MQKETGHKSVGAIIRNESGKFLMLERKFEPLGWASPAGHIDEGETPEEAMIREVKEETDLNVKEWKSLTHEFIPWNNCRSGKGHDWFLFEVVVWDGEPKRAESEANKLAWVAPKDFKKYSLEKIWVYWFEKLGII